MEVVQILIHWQCHKFGIEKVGKIRYNELEEILVFLRKKDCYEEERNCYIRIVRFYYWGSC